MLDIWKEYINPCLVAILQMSLPLLIGSLEFETNEKIGVNLSFVHPYRDFRTNLMPRRPRLQQHSHDECICNLWLTACGFCTRLLSVIAKTDEYAKFDLAILLYRLQDQQHVSFFFRVLHTIFPTCGRMTLPALSLWPGRQSYRPRLLDDRRGGGPSPVALRRRNPPTERRRDSPISSSLFSHGPPMCAGLANRASPLQIQPAKTRPPPVPF